MVDIASLAIKIDTSDLSRGEQALDKLATAGAKAEKAADGVGDAWKSAGDGIGKAGTAAGGATAGIDRAGQAARRQAEIMKQAGLSAGQYNNAMRMLPMQLTDVVTSLSSGMPLWQVAIQQGGQIRDSFGGIGNAARGVAAAIPPAGAAIAGLAVVAGGLLVAYQQGQNEAQAYSKSLILTGNAAGTSADQLAAMAESIDEVAGTQRNAAQALAEVAGTGRFAADQIQGIAQAAIQMERATGKAVSDTVKEFARLADEPAAASAKLNEQYNYLTASVYEQIAALESEGRTTEAAKLATDAYASAIQQRALDIEENLGALERAWRGLGDVAGKAWDAMLNIGREDTLEQQLAEVDRQLQQRQNSIYRGSIFGRGDEGELQQRRTELELLIQQRDTESAWAAEQARINEAGIAAQRAISAELQRSASNADKLKARYKEIDKLVRDAAAAGKEYSAAQVEQLRAAAREQFKDPQQPRQRAYTDDAATRMLAQLRQQEASLQAQLAGNDRLSAAQQAQVQFAQQIADLKEKRILTAEQKSLLANQEAISAQLARNVAIDEELRKREQANELERLRIDILRSSGQREAANEAQFELDYARQRLEYERSGNVEALARLETLKKIREIEAQQSVRPGTVEGVSVAPDMGGLDGAVTGVSGEAARLAEQAAALDQWRTSELEKQQAYLDAKAIGEEVYAERVANIHEQHQQELNELETARQQLSMAQSEALFGGMADLARVFAGEQSNAYRVMFAAQKAYSVASVLLSSADSIGKAWASAPFPANLPAVATTIAQTGALQALVNGVSLAGMAHDGYDSIPKEGTWLLDKGERVVDSRTNGDLKSFLSQQSQPSGGGNVTVNLNEDASRAGSTQMRNIDGKQILDVFVSNIRADGQASKAIQSAFGVRRAGR